MDLIKAVVIAAALIAGLLLIPAIIAVLGPIAIIGLIIFGIWFFLQIVKEDDPPE